MWFRVYGLRFRVKYIKFRVRSHVGRLGKKMESTGLHSVSGLGRPRLRNADCAEVFRGVDYQDALGVYEL